MLLSRDKNSINRCANVHFLDWSPVEFPRVQSWDHGHFPVLHINSIIGKKFSLNVLFFEKVSDTSLFNVNITGFS